MHIIYNIYNVCIHFSKSKFKSRFDIITICKLFLKLKPFVNTNQIAVTLQATFLLFYSFILNMLDGF